MLVVELAMFVVAGCDAEGGSLGDDPREGDRDLAKKRFIFLIPSCEIVEGAVTTEKVM